MRTRLILTRKAELRWWARAFAGQCRDALDELAFLAPWAELLSSRHCPEDMPDLLAIPTLRALEALENNAPANHRTAAQRCRHTCGEHLV